MPTPTTRLRLMKPDPGTELNTWGQKLNQNVFDMLDEAAGVEKITLSAATYTLTSSNYASDQARNAALIFQGSPAATVAVTIPAVEKVYTCANDTAQTVTLGCGGTVATLAAGDRATVWCDGTDCGLGSISAQTVNGLILAASLSPGTLPGQTGNAGKFLQTNGTSPVWATVTIPDIAGGADATVTASTTLTNTSSVVQSGNMAADAQSITLPDATTLSEGGRKFVVVNAGNRTFGVRSNGGTLLTVVPAGAVAELHLYDNGTAAGGWGVTGRGLEPALTLLDHTFSTTYSNPFEPALKMGDTVSLHFLLSGAGGLYAVAVDHGASPATVGTPTLVESTPTPSNLVPFRLSDTLAVATYTRAGVTYAAAITLSGTTLTVGTPVSSGAGLSPSFTGAPAVATLTASTMVFQRVNDVRALTVSGTVVSWGSAVAVGSTPQQALACYRISDTTALALYIDDSGAAGSPYSIRGAVLSVSGTTITAGTSAGANDVTPSLALSTCQLSATKYLAVRTDASALGAYAYAITVSGTTVTFGSALTVEAAGSGTNLVHASNNANRFQPNLYPIDGTRALFTYSMLSSPSRHVILTESSGSVTAGTTLFSLWTDQAGGNFPQTPAGFLAFSTAAAEMAVFGVTVSGTALTVTGEFSDGAVVPLATASARFGLSGGVSGIRHDSAARSNLFHLFRFGADGPPRWLGALRLNDITLGAFTPVEVASNKVAVIAGAGASQPTATGDNVRLLIVEFASS